MENFKICMSEKTKEEVKTDWGLGNANFLNQIFIFIIRRTTFLSFKMCIKTGHFFFFLHSDQMCITTLCIFAYLMFIKHCQIVLKENIMKASRSCIYHVDGKQVDSNFYIFFSEHLIAAVWVSFRVQCLKCFYLRFV